MDTAAGGAAAFRAPGWGAGTSKTGHVAIRTKRSATLPSNSRWKPRRPWVPITTRSDFSSSAATSRRCATPSPYRSTSAIRATPLVFCRCIFASASSVTRVPSLVNASRRIVTGGVVGHQRCIDDIDGLQFGTGFPSDLQGCVERQERRLASIDCEQNALIHGVLASAIHNACSRGVRWMRALRQGFHRRG